MPVGAAGGFQTLPALLDDAVTLANTNIVLEKFARRYRAFGAVD